MFVIVSAVYEEHWALWDISSALLGFGKRHCMATDWRTKSKRTTSHHHREWMVIMIWLGEHNEPDTYLHIPTQTERSLRRSA